MFKKIITLTLICSIFILYSFPINLLQADENEERAFYQDKDTSEQLEQSSISDNNSSLEGEQNNLLQNGSNELDLVPPYQKKKVALHRKILNYIHGTKQFKKKRGHKDPHFPEKISFKKHLIPLPAKLQPEGIKDALENGNLNLKKVTAAMILDLPQPERKSLLEFLSTQKVKIKQRCKGKWHGHPIHFIFNKKTNAAVALALRMGSQGEKSALARIICEVPQAVIPVLKGRSKSLLDADVVADILVCMIKHVDHQNMIAISHACTDLVQIYTKYWSHKDVEQLDKCLRDLVQQLKESVHQINLPDGNPDKFAPRKLGVLLGSILAGSLWICTKLQTEDIKRQWMVNSTVNLLRAFTVYLGMVPWLPGNAIAGISGTVSVGLVAGSVAYNYFRVPRDYSATVRQIQGEIKLSALDSVDPDELKDITRILLMVEYMDAIVNANGEPA